MGREKKIAGLVVAAGFSSRAPGFKPLLPLGTRTVIESVINVIYAAGIDDIVVVTGHRSGELIPVLDRLRVRHVLNGRYEEGMFSSVVMGVKSLSPGTDAFFLLPADMPLVRCHTLSTLRKSYSRAAADVLYPVFQGRRGHPPLISSRCIPDILAWNRDGGLRSVLAIHESRSRNVEVIDEGILLDVDTAEDYRNVADRFGKRDFPGLRECEAILSSARTQERAARHCRTVAETGRILSDALNRTGMRLDADLVSAGGMLHDIAKGRPHHARTGARMVLKLGFPDVASIIAVHHTVDFEEGMPLDEAAVLFLADKLVLGDRIVSLDERFRECLEKYADDAQVISEVRQRLQRARLMVKAVEQATGMKIPDLLRDVGSTEKQVVHE